MNHIKMYLKSKTHLELGLMLVVIVSCVLSIFLSVQLIKYYSSNVKTGSGELIYVFEENTISFSSLNNISDADISEQYLSYSISYGVDVSEWQGTIDWEKVANTGISFAIIRCGFRQTVGKEIKEDAKFRENIEGAINAGLKVGVYFFGTAKNEEEALEEAEFTYNLIKDYNLTYPVVYDFETFDTGRLINISYDDITDNILTFTETLGSYGYETMVYSYYNAFMYKLNTGKLEGKLIWLAHYTDETNYTGNYNMWQYTSEGMVDGINTNVDLNISYFTYVDDEDDIIENPNYVNVANESFESTNDYVKVKSSAVIRSSSTTEVPNKLGTVKKGTVLERTGVGDKFSIVTYNGRSVYILNSDISEYNE